MTRQRKFFLTKITLVIMFTPMFILWGLAALPSPFYMAHRSAIESIYTAFVITYILTLCGGGLFLFLLFTGDIPDPKEWRGLIEQKTV